MKTSRIVKALVGLLACCSALSGRAAVLPMGAGSIADVINPAGYGCVVDYGNWIVSAGVVLPGIAGCDPKGDPNGVPYGSPTKIYPHLVGPAAARPTATHRWWGSVPFYGEGQVNGSGAGYLTADPIFARVSNRGLRVLAIPNGLRGDPNQFTYPVPTPSSEVFDGIAIGNSLYAGMNAFMKDSSDGSITVEWRSGPTPVMQATLVHGSPYVFFEVYSGTPVIRTKAATGAEKGVFLQTSNALGVWTNVASVRNHFLIVGDGATTFTNPGATETPFTPANNRFTLVWLPVTGTDSPTAAMIADFQQYALNRVAKVSIGYAVEPATQAVTVTHDYLDANGAGVTTMAGMMPLHWKRSSQPLSAYKARSARGMIRFAPTSRFSYRMPFVGVLPLLPNQLTPGDDARLRALVTEFVAAGPASWNAKRDTYWSGKAYGKVAEVAAIARSLGMSAEANAMINWLRSELQDWFSAGSTAVPDATKYFSYDRDWATLLGHEESFGTQQQLNDHHFHYGYFIRAAAEVCRVDASWCAAGAYGPVIEMLIRDFAAGRDDPMFPYLRNFDPANGFSWASGHANFALGNNNESTSEAANAYGAIVLYGLITGNQELVNRGVYLHASTTAAYWEYWNNLDAYYGKTGDDNNFPGGYSKLATSIIWGAGGVFSTWFSGATAHVLGIQGLPLNPLVLHIGQYPDYLGAYVTLGLSQSSNGQPSGLPPGQWTDIWWNILAMTDAQRASNDFDGVNLNYTVEEGETKAHTFHWIQAFKALGQVESGRGTLTADYPAAVAFRKSGLLTYLAYNLGSSAIRVTFSDGMAMNVPARTLGTKRTGDTPDPPLGSGDKQAPTTPGTPVASLVTATTARLSWTASTDNVAVTSYLVTAAGLTRSTATASIDLTGLAANTSYAVTVVALDAAGNRSGPSSGSFVTPTVPDVQAPTTPGVPVASSVTASSATLSWTASTDNVAVTGYEIKIGINTMTSAAPTLALVGLTASTLYAVEVRAFDAAGNRSAASVGSFSSAAAPCTSGCPGPLPAPWIGADIGGPTPGASGFSSGVFTTTASGADIWGTVDSFRFVYQSLTGDGQVTARVDALDVTDAWAKAGVMMRATLDSNSPHAMMVVTAGNGTGFQHRPSAGAASIHVAGPVASSPYWVRMVREGSLFTAYASINGSSWTRVGSQSIVMPGTLFVGLAHTSHRNGVLGKASYSNVAVAGAAPPSPTVRHVRLEALSEVNGGPWASIAEFNLLDLAGAVMPRTGWVVSADSQAGGYPASSAVDGNAATIWHTPWSPSSLPMPHSLTVDLGSLKSVGGFRYLPRQDGNNNGKLANWRLQTSVDGIAWVTVVQGSFTASAAEQTVLIPR